MKTGSSNLVIVVAATLLAVGCASTPTVEERAPETKPVTEVKPAEPAPAPAPTAAPAPTTMSYNVVRGDHLWGISGKSTIYGNPYQWPLIFKANRGKIEDADLIHPGQILSIDKNPSQADVASAVTHAKTRGAWQLGVAEKSDADYLNGTATRVSSK